MELSKEICIRAMRSKDARFDGKFFTGVYSTGIYCRPICPAPIPKLKNIQFFPSAAAASDAGLRPCLRCKPEVAPGFDSSKAPGLISKALKLIFDSFPLEIKVNELARQLQISNRHLNRLFQQHLGTTPFSIWNTQKIHFAKRLIDETALSMSEIAFFAGFNSIRSFNHSFKKCYQKSPSELRNNKKSTNKDQWVTLHLSYREPFNWIALLDFLKLRAIPGVEKVFDNGYQRVIRIGEDTGMIGVSMTNLKKSKPVFQVKIAFSDNRKLHFICEKVKKMFNLEAPAAEIDHFLKKDKILKSSVQQNEGIRVPGCWDPFELCVRAILGQQISVKGATTISGRIVEKYGQKYQGSVINDNQQNWFEFPKASILKDATFDGIGLTKSRIETLKSFAIAVHQKDIDFENNFDSEIMVNQLKEIKGIGDWTAQYFAMRALNDPNAFPVSDLGLIKAVSSPKETVKPKDLLKLSQKWSPWRATAAMYLWRMN
ncbi:MAG: DNA-3-methyladenine glycosylase 2 family protein [Deltaproteobacteria bacterium]|nr:DNA-3-methyladenine glycosylase 2 family protein [Deltaproteobacteria bacterium]